MTELYCRSCGPIRRLARRFRTSRHEAESLAFGYTRDAYIQTLF